MIDRKQKIKELMRGMDLIRKSLLPKDEECLDHTKITHSQTRVLMFVHLSNNASIKNIAKDLEISSSAATQLVDSLVKKSLIARKENPQDRRVVTVTLSQSVKKKVSKLKNTMTKKFLKIFSALDDNEFEQFVHSYGKIINWVSSKK